MSPNTRESPVATEKIALDQASRRRPRSAGGAVGSASTAPTIRGGSATLLLPSFGPRLRAFSRHGEHQTTEEANPHRRRRAAREPALPLDDQDADEASHRRNRRRRQGNGGHRTPQPRQVDRQGGLAWRAASEHGRAEEVAGGAVL